MKTGKYIRRAAAICMAMALLTGSALADAVTVTAERLNVRTEANANSRAVTVVRQGEKLQYVSESGAWIRVNANGRSGYVMKQYVTVDADEIAADVAAAQTAYGEALTGRAAVRVNMRALPVTSSDIVKVVGKRQSVTLTGECGDWYLVSFGGKTGYIMKEYVEAEETAPQASPEPTVPEQSVQPASGTPSTTLSEYAEPLSGAVNTRVNMRAAAGTGSKVVKVLAEGTPVTVTGELGSWYHVSALGKTGYIMQPYVTLTAPSAGSTGAQEQPAQPENADYAEPVAAKVNTRVNMRTGATTHSAIVKVLANGASVSVTGESGGWYKVTAAGRSGYIYRQYVTLESGAQPAVPEATPAPTPNPNVETAYVSSVSATATARVNMRADASASSAIVKVIGLNDSVTVAGEKGDWYKVNYGGRTGYVMKEYLTLTQAAETVTFESWVGVADVEVNMRKAPEGDVMYVLRQGTEVTVTGQNGSWYLITYRGSVGYVASSYISKKIETVSAAPSQAPTQAPASNAAGTTGYVSGAAVNLRSGAGTNYGVLTVVRRGDELTLYEQVGDWYRVAAGSVNGYISAKYVTTTKPESGSSAGATGVDSAGTTGNAGSKVLADDWWTGSVANTIKRGTTATITDVDTGLSFQFKRTGGINHMDAQPLTTDDTAIMYKIYDYKWQWTRRAIWVTYNGVTYAASMNGMPHGDSDSMPDNGFDGCFCIHFTNSRTHDGNRLDAAHQAAILKALRVGNS